MLRINAIVSGINLIEVDRRRLKKLRNKKPYVLSQVKLSLCDTFRVMKYCLVVYSNLKQIKDFDTIYVSIPLKFRKRLLEVSKSGIPLQITISENNPKSPHFKMDEYFGDVICRVLI